VTVPVREAPPSGAPATRVRRGLAAAVVGMGLVAAGCVPSPPPLEQAAGFAAEDDVELPAAAATSVLRRAQEVTVRIRSLGCDRFGIGSGFVLPGGIVVTNRHVVDEPRRVTLNTWDGVSLDADVTGIAVDSDLAVLRLADDADLPVAELRTTPVQVGETVVAVGYPGGGPATVTTGEVLGMVDVEDLLGEPSPVIRVDATIRQGNSGGPLLDEEGRVVGVVFALEVGTGHGLAVPVDTLLERLGGERMAAPSGDC
jgi:S1-C subfamily serine protease